MDDIDSFIEAYIEAYWDMANYKYTTREEVENYFKWLYHRDKDGFILAEDNNEIAGFAGADTNWLGVDGEKILEIHEIFVLPKFREKDIGYKLLMECLAYGKRRGRRLAELWVGRKNYKSIKFYEKCGFERAGERGKWLRMIKLLDS
ncbi:GNAT family N-acetyltransferase [Desulfothermus okinawensis JCM 13304]